MPDDTTFASDMHPQAERGVSTAARKLSEGLGDLGRALNQGSRDLVEPAARLVREQPLAAAGIAFGVGYLLGGGLSRKMAGRLLRLGWRLGGMALVRNVLTSVGGPAGEGI
jgi:ElaB/YqjD/DUF883 family membrane-anchored ribosome-binding protein